MYIILNTLQIDLQGVYKFVANYKKQLFQSPYVVVQLYIVTILLHNFSTICLLHFIY